MLLRSQSISYFNVRRTIWFKCYQNGDHIGRRFESCARSIFRNAYFLQPLFWRFYVVAVLVTLKPDSTLNAGDSKFVETQKIVRNSNHKTNDTSVKKINYKFVQNC